MSMEKAINSKKEYRKKYYGVKSFCCSCRNHGTCPTCTMNRLIKNIKRYESLLDKEKDL